MAHRFINMGYRKEKIMIERIGNIVGGAVMGLAVFTLVFGWVF